MIPIWEFITVEVVLGFTVTTAAALTAQVISKLIVDNIAEPIDELYIDPLTAQVKKFISNPELWDKVDRFGVLKNFSPQAAIEAAVNTYEETVSTLVLVVSENLMTEMFDPQKQDAKRKQILASEDTVIFDDETAILD